MHSINHASDTATNILLRLGYRSAFAIFALFYIVTFFPMLSGNVVLPYAQLTELGVTPEGDPLTDFSQIKTGPLNDIPLAFIPNAHEMLRGDQAGLFNTWTNSSELGKPLPQRSYSTTWLPNWLLSKITTDAFVYYTLHCAIMAFMAGVFTFLLCQAFNLHPFSCLCAAIILSTWPHNIYRFGFSMHIASFCWSIAVMYAVYLYYHKPRAWHLLLLSFSIYSLLLTGYLQELVFLAYMVCAFGLYLTFRKYSQFGLTATLRFIVYCALSVLVGVLVSLPVIIDLLYDISIATRNSKSVEFFLSDLPSLKSGSRIIKFLATTFYADLFGNPLSDNYPFNSQGRSFNLILLFLLPLSFALNSRTNKYLWASILILASFAIITPLYKFGIAYLGFNISPISPLMFMILPMTLIAARTIEQVIQQEIPPDKLIIWSQRTAKLAAFTLIPVIAYLIPKLVKDWSYPIDWLYLACVLLLIKYFPRLALKGNFPSVVAIALISSTLYSSWNMLARETHNRSDLLLHSEFSKQIQTALPKSSNFAIVSKEPSKYPPDWQIMSPNIHVLAGLSAVHTFNSISSRHYSTLIGKLNGEVHVNGRYNFNVNPDFSSPEFYYANIGLILSAEPIQHKNLNYLKKHSGMYFYKNNFNYNCCKIYTVNESAANAAYPLMKYLSLPSSTAEKVVDKTNLLEFKIVPTSKSIMILPQKYHGKWKASTLSNGTWHRAETFAAGDIFQAVEVPASTTYITLQFKPLIDYAWVAFVVFFLWFLYVITARKLNGNV